MTLTKTLRMLTLPLVAAAALTFTAFGGRAEAQTRARTTAAATQTAGTVNLNTATEEELDRLPGVGPSKAARIVEWRKKHGAFKRIEDLTRVKGFGRKTLQKLKPYLSVSGPTTLKAVEKPKTDSIVSRPPAEEAP